MADKTIRNMDITDSTVVSGSATLRTFRPEPGSPIVEVPQQTQRTMPTQRTQKTFRADAPQGESQGSSGQQFTLRGEIYENVECLSDNSGEAQVFLVRRNGEEYVLKVYYPHFDVNKKLLQVIKSFDFEMIVKLLDFGKTYVDGKHRYYELMEYLRGGTLYDYKLNGDYNQFRRIALQAAASLAYCHNNNILHKDIKPSNFFFRDVNHQELVLGDFGISSILEKDGKSHRTTQARTPIYAAPEMYSDVIDGVVEITPAADFYSLGITLFALWLGENPMSSNERVMMRQKNEGRLPRLNELPEEVKHIIQGLTAVNPTSRWGYDEVERWFQGEDVKVDISSPFLRYKSFIVDPERNLVADNVHELIPLLVDNERLAMNYLYNGRISNWLESCGNTKLSSAVKDIVVNRYPVNQKAGLMSAVYTMEPTYPYKDVKGNLCDDIHSVALSLLSYQEQYSVLLQNPHDNLFLYLETHSKCDIERLRSYFNKEEKESNHIGILKTIYEIDPEIPFLGKFPSGSIQDIVHSFGYENVTEDEWRSLCDGRLLSWMYSHEDVMACESLRIMTKDQDYSPSLAYKVLYNIDRAATYDLRGADTPEKVGQLLNERLKNAEHMADDDFAREMQDIIEPDGRFAYYAQLHGWNAYLSEATRCFDLKSAENRERLGAYDIKSAVYRFCRILGVTPVYLLPDGSELTDGLSIDTQHASQIRGEMRNGSFSQWLSVFYHEDSTRDFSEEYSYEHALEEWVMALGKFDKSNNYYKRFIDAREETIYKINEVRKGWKHAKAKEHTWQIVFYALCAIWVCLVAFIGVSGRSYIMGHTFLTIGLPLGGMTAIIVGTRAYFRGYGFVFSALWGLLGALSAGIPIMVLRYTHSNLPPAFFNIIIIAMTLVYMLICHLTDFRGDTKDDNRLVNDVLDDDIKSSLLEPLYYTFKTKSYRYKGSKFSVLDDVTDQIRSLSGESVLHYILWSALVLVFVLDFVIFSPKLMNVSNPDFGNNMREQPQKVIKQIEKDLE